MLVVEVVEALVGQEQIIHKEQVDQVEVGLVVEVMYLLNLHHNHLMLVVQQEQLILEVEEEEQVLEELLQLQQV